MVDGDLFPVQGFGRVSKPRLVRLTGPKKDRLLFMAGLERDFSIFCRKINHASNRFEVIVDYWS